MKSFLVLSLSLCASAMAIGGPSNLKIAKNKIQDELRELEKFDYPKPLVYLLLSRHVYGYAEAGDEVLSDMQELSDRFLAGWKVAFVKNTSDGYQSALYLHKNSLQAVLAHKGTDGIGTGIADLIEIIGLDSGKQLEFAREALQESIDLLIDISETENINYILSVTGHSLGAWLAEMSAFLWYYDFLEEGARFTAQKAWIHVVTFDSPGSATKMIHDYPHVGGYNRDKFLANLDITTYLSNPNIVNTAHPHVGTVYAVHTSNSDQFKESQTKELLEINSWTLFFWVDSPWKLLKVLTITAPWVYSIYAIYKGFGYNYPPVYIFMYNIPFPVLSAFLKYLFNSNNGDMVRDILQYPWRIISLLKKINEANIAANSVLTHKLDYLIKAFDHETGLARNLQKAIDWPATRWDNSKDSFSSEVAEVIDDAIKGFGIPEGSAQALKNLAEILHSYYSNKISIKELIGILDGSNTKNEFVRRYKYHYNTSPANYSNACLQTDSQGSIAWVMREINDYPMESLHSVGIENPETAWRIRFMKDRIQSIYLTSEAMGCHTITTDMSGGIDHLKMFVAKNIETDRSLVEILKNKHPPKVTWKKRGIPKSSGGIVFVHESALSDVFKKISNERVSILQGNDPAEEYAVLLNIANQFDGNVLWVEVCTNEPEDCTENKLSKALAWVLWQPSNDPVQKHFDELAKETEVQFGKYLLIFAGVRLDWIENYLRNFSENVHVVLILIDQSEKNDSRDKYPQLGVPSINNAEAVEVLRQCLGMDAAGLEAMPRFNLTRQSTIMLCGLHKWLPYRDYSDAINKFKELDSAVGQDPNFSNALLSVYALSDYYLSENNSTASDWARFILRFASRQTTPPFLRVLREVCNTSEKDFNEGVEVLELLGLANTISNSKCHAIRVVPGIDGLVQTLPHIVPDDGLYRKLFQGEGSSLKLLDDKLDAYDDQRKKHAEYCMN